MHRPPRARPCVEARVAHLRDAASASQVRSYAHFSPLNAHRGSYAAAARKEHIRWRHPPRRDCARFPAGSTYDTHVWMPASKNRVAAAQRQSTICPNRARKNRQPLAHAPPPPAPRASCRLVKGSNSSDESRLLPGSAQYMVSRVVNPMCGWAYWSWTSGRVELLAIPCWATVRVVGGGGSGLAHAAGVPSRVVECKSNTAALLREAALFVPGCDCNFQVAPSDLDRLI